MKCMLLLVAFAGCGKNDKPRGFDFALFMDPSTHQTFAGSIQTCAVTKVYNMDRVPHDGNYIVKAVPDAAFSGGVRCNNQAKGSVEMVFRSADEAKAPAVKAGQNVRVEITKGSIGIGPGYKPIVIFRLFESESPQ